jgi:ABC-type sulfate/molybdate transport systems ATPase subunit
MLDAHIVKARPHFTVDAVVRVASGESSGLFGVSGSGKTTILACIAGAETPDGGHVNAGGIALFPPALPLHRRSLGYLAQEPNLFPHLSVAGNVRFGLRDGARDASEAWVTELRERLGLEAIWNASARAISGGQARRVALARMLARRPPLVLLDEPFGGLDRHLVRELLATLADWQQRLGFAMLVVDHEASVLARLTTRAIAIEAGRVLYDAPWPELFAAPATPLLARLLAPL